MEHAPRSNRFEFVVVAGQRARQLLAGSVPRESGEKKVTIAQREVLRHKVSKVEPGDTALGDGAPVAETSEQA